MSIRAKLYTGFLLLVLLTSALGIGSLIQLRTVTDATNALLRHEVTTALQAVQIGENATAIAMYVNAVLLTGNQDDLTAISGHVERNDALIASLVQNADPAIRRHGETVKQAVVEYRTHWNEALQLQRNGQESQAATLVERDVRPAMAEVLASIHGLE